jgi:hypothetical protein
VRVLAGQSGEFMNMQREAERRVMEMQRRAKQAVQPEEPPKQEWTSSASAVSQPPKRNFLELINLKSLFEGKDTSLVLMVLALLSSDDSDPLLMLALLYVMM